MEHETGLEPATPTLARDDEPEESPPLVEALAAGLGVEVAALNAGVSPRTLRRWRSERHAFSEALVAARRTALADALGSVRSLVNDAVTCLRAVLADTGAPPAARVRAASIVIGAALRAWELETQLTSPEPVVERLLRQTR